MAGTFTDGSCVSCPIWPKDEQGVQTHTHNQTQKPRIPRKHINNLHSVHSECRRPDWSHQGPVKHYPLCDSSHSRNSLCNVFLLPRLFCTIVALITHSISVGINKGSISILFHANESAGAQTGSGSRVRVECGSVCSLSLVAWLGTSKFKWA